MSKTRTDRVLDAVFDSLATDSVTATIAEAILCYGHELSEWDALDIGDYAMQLLSERNLLNKKQKAVKK